MLIAASVRLVDACRRHAWLAAVVILAFAALAGVFAIHRLGLDTDTDKLVAENQPWRQRDLAYDRIFPQFVNLMVVVVDGATPDIAEDATAALAARLARRSDLFKSVRRPDGGPFFAKNGVLFLPADEVQGLTDQLIAAQPLIGTLAADPSARGLFGALGLALEGVSRGDTSLSTLDAPLGAVARSIEASLAGKPAPLDWQRLLTGRAPQPEELRHFILVQPKLDFGTLEAGASSEEFVRRAAESLGLTPDRGVRIRLTGTVPLNDDELASVKQGSVISGVLSLTLVGLFLFLGLRSPRIILAILVTLVAGLLVTLAFAAATVRVLNPISIAFAVMFVGIAVDFGIQFSMRYREARARTSDPAEAMRKGARRVAASLLLAAAATAIGFLSFVPTTFVGVAQLGLIAGGGMIIAVLLNLTLLPALLTLLKPPPEKAEIGFSWTAGLDRLMVERRGAVLAVCAGLAVLALATLPRLHFDFNPLHLKDPRTESMATLLDLMKDPTSTPFTIDVLTPSPAAAAELSKRIAALPQVSSVLSINSFVPEDQAPKLVSLADAELLVGPTLDPPAVAPPPDAAAVRAAINQAAARLKALSEGAKDAAATRTLGDLEALLARDDAAVMAAATALVPGLPERLAALRLMLQAAPVTLDTLPADLVRDWVAPQGQARVAVYPRGDSADNATLVGFVGAVRTIAPDATGAPISVQESSRSIVDAFIRAAIGAVLAIAALLAVVLRRAADVARVLLPLIFAGLLTLATCVVVGVPINFANIIALPLLLGIGVAFDIYFVMNWRAGLTHPLQSATARAVLFSACTTMSAFGSLALSGHRGTASLGLLLTIALGYTLAATWLMLPALLAPPMVMGSRRTHGLPSK